MKKILLALSLLAVVGTASAQHHGYHGGYHGYYRGNNWGWVAPAVIGGAVVYAATRPPVYVQQPQIVVVPQQPQQMVVPYAPPAGFHWEQILDANCNCTRLVLVQG